MNTETAVGKTARRRVRGARWSTVGGCVLGLALPAAVEAQFAVTSTNGAINILAYYGPGGVVTIPGMIDGLPVTSIGAGAFDGITGLISVTIPASVTNIQASAFQACYRLTSVYFDGNAPAADSTSFQSDHSATIYYLPGTMGWGATFGNLPTAVWNPEVQVGNAQFGVGTNGFGFTIAGTSNLVVVVEACADLAHPVWSPVGTNTLSVSYYFSDPNWASYPARFYRLRRP